MGKSRAPTPPSPGATAGAQAQANIQTATANAALNNVNQVTPWGNVNYDVTGQSYGVPTWTQTTTLSPNQQTMNDLQEQQGILLGQLGIDQTNAVSDILGTNYEPRRFDMNAVTGGPLDIGAALGDPNGDIESRYRELAQRGIGEDFDRREESLRSRLAAQGVNAGTDAFEAELRGLGNQRADSFARAQLGAREMAMSDRQNALAEILTQRGTNIGEAGQQYSYDNTADLAARQNPLNEIIALMSGNQTNPINPGQPNSYNINPVDIAGITNSAYQGQLGAWQQNQQTASANTGAAAGVLTAAIVAM